MAKGKPKGSQKTGGRVAGVPNKSNSLAREAIARFVDGNAERLSEWLEQIAMDSPKDAFNCFTSVLEYHVPKLARTEITGKNGEAIETKSTIDVTKLSLATLSELMNAKDANGN